jgi:hypothetical protein
MLFKVLNLVLITIGFFFIFNDFHKVVKYFSLTNNIYNYKYYSDLQFKYIGIVKLLTLQLIINKYLYLFVLN